ncbi:putative acid phosphatase [Seiridium cardinale]|uniref:Acid phosphatase n=1 Tax=Seiridium cardinale TaxID=138064 RepID=A0ABR2XR13_9PEZI
MAFSLRNIAVFTAAILGTTAQTTNATLYTKNGLTWSSTLRMNQMQVIGTHNSYHREVSLAEKPYHALLLSDPENYYYSHSDLAHQAEYQGLRNFEIDIWADPQGGLYGSPLIRRMAHLDMPDDPGMNKSGTKVLHVPDADVGVSCYTLISCLTQLRTWSKRNPAHVPVPVMIEYKQPGGDLSSIGGARPVWWNNTELLDSLDAEFRSVFSTDELITPDDIRRDNLTLEQSILTYGWPDLDSARGRFFFLMDSASTGELGVTRNASTWESGRPNAEGRVVFPQSNEGQPDCAFRKMNSPTAECLPAIQEAVSKGYWVRTRSDEPITTVLSNDTWSRREAAFASGAHIVSTDFPFYGMAARWGVYTNLLRQLNMSAQHPFGKHHLTSLRVASFRRVMGDVPIKAETCRLFRIPAEILDKIIEYLASDCNLKDGANMALVNSDFLQISRIIRYRFVDFDFDKHSIELLRRMLEDRVSTDPKTLQYRRLPIGTAIRSVMYTYTDYDSTDPKTGLDWVKIQEQVAAYNALTGNRWGELAKRLSPDPLEDEKYSSEVLDRIYDPSPFCGDLLSSCSDTLRWLTLENWSSTLDNDKNYQKPLGFTLDFPELAYLDTGLHLNYDDSAAQSLLSSPKLRTLITDYDDLIMRDHLEGLVDHKELRVVLLNGKFIPSMQLKLLRQNRTITALSIMDPQEDDFMRSLPAILNDLPYLGTLSLSWEGTQLQLTTLKSILKSTSLEVLHVEARQRNVNRHEWCVNHEELTEYISSQANLKKLVITQDVYRKPESEIDDLSGNQYYEPDSVDPMN